MCSSVVIGICVVLLICTVTRCGQLDVKTETPRAVVNNTVVHPLFRQKKPVRWSFFGYEHLFIFWAHLAPTPTMLAEKFEGGGGMVSQALIPLIDMRCTFRRSKQLWYLAPAPHSSFFQKLFSDAPCGILAISFRPFGATQDCSRVSSSNGNSNGNNANSAKIGGYW